MKSYLTDIRRPDTGRIIFLLTAVFIFLLHPADIAASGNNEQINTESSAEKKIENIQTGPAETAVIAGGCFWGIEGVFERVKGVIDVVSGYSGGDAETASYHKVGTGTTGHAESVKIIFNPEMVSYRKLLEIFFTVAHDPTQLNYQGPDVGTEYRSVVFYENETQKLEAEDIINTIEKKGIYRDPIVTEITPLAAFYPAEDYHQDFMRLNPNHPYIVYWDMPKITLLKKSYPELVTME